MLKYVSKFVLEIMSSIVATVIGAYIVNHYIIAKPASNAPVAAVLSTPSAKTEAPEADIKTPAKPVTDTVAVKAATAAVHEHPAVSHERTVIKAASTAPEPASQSRERRERETMQQHDANDLARAAIERLGLANRNSRSTDVSVTAPREQTHVGVPATSAVRPLPPAINISTPAVELPASPQGSEPVSLARIGVPSGAMDIDPNRPIPPAEIPSMSRLSGASADAAIRQPQTVADDMFAAAKSVFHAVLPR